jgi:hypothetical protein
LLERFSPHEGWIDDPSLLRTTAIGGHEDFWRVTEKEARAAVVFLYGQEAELRAFGA